jgi:hypothetical protein
MSLNEQTLDGHAIGAGGLAGGLAIGAHCGPRFLQSGIPLQTVLLASLGQEICMVTHNGVYGDSLWTSGLAEAASMATVKCPERFYLYIQQSTI